MLNILPTSNSLLQCKLKLFSEFMSHDIQTVPSEKLYCPPNHPSTVIVWIFFPAILKYLQTYKHKSREAACFLYLDMFSSPTVDYVHKSIPVLQKNTS